MIVIAALRLPATLRFHWGPRWQAGSDLLGKSRVFHLHLQEIVVALGLLKGGTAVACELKDQPPGHVKMRAKGGADALVDAFDQLGMSAALFDRIALG